VYSTLRRYLRPRLSAPLVGGELTVVQPKFSALSGVDFPNIRPVFAVKLGDPVRVGQLLFTDRKHPEIAWVAPMAGVIESIEYGSGRILSSIVIRAIEGAENPLTDVPRIEKDDDLRKVLQARGMWPAFLNRPYGRIPLPDATPEAIFVIATETEPYAPDPDVVLRDRRVEFEKGIRALALLTNGIVHVCLPEKYALEASDHPRIRINRLSGPHPAGLAGTHIRRLHPVNSGGSVWSIGYQDLIAIGHLLMTGQYLPDRVISFAGPRTASARLVRTVVGARIRDIASDERKPNASEVPFTAISGSILSGRISDWLGYRHRQVSTINNAPRLQKRRKLKYFHGQNSTFPLVPTTGLERAMPFFLPVVPLMRALSVGDAETAERLGCLDLVEEDMALLSSMCTSGADYGYLLRCVLDDLADAA